VLDETTQKYLTPSMSLLRIKKECQIRLDAFSFMLKSENALNRRPISLSSLYSFSLKTRSGAII
jgi:hypothetical protein